MNKTPKSKADQWPGHQAYREDIISRMEAMQQRFGRLQLCDTPPESERAFDGEDAEDWQRRSEEQGTE